jgi:hypothetical protein
MIHRIDSELVKPIRTGNGGGVLRAAQFSIASVVPFARTATNMPKKKGNKGKAIKMDWNEFSQMSGGPMAGNELSHLPSAPSGMDGPRQFGAAGGFDGPSRAERQSTGPTMSGGGSGDHRPGGPMGGFGGPSAGFQHDGSFDGGPPPSAADEDNNWRGSMGPTTGPRGGPQGAGFGGGIERGGFDGGDPRGQGDVMMMRGQGTPMMGAHADQDQDWRGGAGPISRGPGPGPHQMVGDGYADQAQDWRGAAGPTSRPAGGAMQPGVSHDTNWRDSAGPTSRADVPSGNGVGATGRPTSAFDSDNDWRSNSTGPVVRTAEDDAARAARDQQQDWRSAATPVSGVPAVSPDAEERADPRASAGAGPTTDPRHGRTEWTRGEMVSAAAVPTTAVESRAGGGFSAGDPRGQAAVVGPGPQRGGGGFSAGDPRGQAAVVGPGPQRGGGGFSAGDPRGQAPIENGGARYQRGGLDSGDPRGQMTSSGPDGQGSRYRNGGRPKLKLLARSAPTPAPAPEPQAN